jgi:hypothetical protein
MNKRRRKEEKMKKIIIIIIIIIRGLTHYRWKIYPVVPMG